MKGVIEMASTVKRDGRAVVTTCGGCYADCAFAARVEDGRVVAELPVPGHPCAGACPVRPRAASPGHAV